MEWNFGFERPLPSAMKLSTDYVGSVGRRLIVASSENIAVLGPGSIDSRRPLHNAGSFHWRNNGGGSSYNALQVKLEREFKSGLTFLNSYTCSKSMDTASDGNGYLGRRPIPIIPVFLMGRRISILPMSTQLRLSMSSHSVGARGLCPTQDAL